MIPKCLEQLKAIIKDPSENARYNGLVRWMDKYVKKFGCCISKDDSFFRSKEEAKKYFDHMKIDIAANAGIKIFEDPGVVRCDIRNEDDGRTTHVFCIYVLQVSDEEPKG